MSGANVSSRYDYGSLFSDATGPHQDTRRYQQVIQGFMPYLAVRGATNAESADLLKCSHEVSNAFNHNRLMARGGKDTSSEYTMGKLFECIGDNSQVRLFTSLSNESWPKFVESINRIYPSRPTDDQTSTQQLWRGCCATSPESCLVGALATIILFANIEEDEPSSENEYLRAFQEQRQPWSPHTDSINYKKLYASNKDQASRSEQLLSQTVHDSMQKTLSTLNITSREGMAAYVENIMNVTCLQAFVQDVSKEPETIPLNFYIRYTELDETKICRAKLLEMVQSHLDTHIESSYSNDQIYIVKCDDLLDSSRYVDNPEEDYYRLNLGEAIMYVAPVELGSNRSNVSFCSGFKAFILSLYRDVNKDHYCYYDDETCAVRIGVSVDEGHA